MSQQQVTLDVGGKHPGTDLRLIWLEVGLPRCFLSLLYLSWTEADGSEGDRARLPRLEAVFSRGQWADSLSGWADRALIVLTASLPKKPGNSGAQPP